MMLPARTRWPPVFLTPRRRPAESRPLREEPPAFLCAISDFPYFFGLAGFFAGALALAAGFFAACFASAFFAACFASGCFWAFFASGFGAAFRSGFGAAFDGFLPSVRISVMRSAVKSRRWPFLRR